MQALSGLLAGDQHAGARDYQEDAFALLELPADGARQWLLVLADGMGGHAGGARASELATTTFTAHFTAHFKDAAGDPHQRLRGAMDAANAAIGEQAAEDPLYAGMGCTLLVCLIADGKLYWLSVGDSPLWLLRDGQMTRLNADHSMRPVLEDLVELGRMTTEQLAKDSRVNQLRSALIGDELPMVDEGQSLDLAEGDQIILASDGLETLPVDDIGAICQACADSAGAVTALREEVTARERPGQDNTTVVVYKHTGAESAPLESEPQSEPETAEVLFSKPSRENAPPAQKTGESENKNRSKKWWPWKKR